MNELISTIKNLIAKPLEEIGYEVIRIKFFNQDSELTLQIMIDHIDRKKTIIIKDCENANYVISAILDVNEDLIKDKYNLEISSPGIDRPLISLQDFQQYISFEAKFTTIENVSSCKKFKATITEIDIDKNEIELFMLHNSEKVKTEISNIISAQLILTDKLIKAHKKDNNNDRDKDE